MSNIRNFVIIAHIDHGKSTLADRFLEITGAVPEREMRPQYLDQLELERERGITIKMAPVRMVYHPQALISKHEFLNKSQASIPKRLEIADSGYILNLIDTPGHSDFSYEVSRALAACEGAILLVDAAKGIQAQTLSNLRSAEKAGLKILGAVNKIDLQPENLEKVLESLAEILKTPKEEILKISAKTGQGVKELLDAVIKKVPPPREVKTQGAAKALIFDSLYDDHKGILAFVRVFEGEFKTGEEVCLLAREEKFKIKESGYFAPRLTPKGLLREGEIGYLATGLKEPDLVKIGDTIAKGEVKTLPGYREAAPVVFISFYPDGRSRFEDLKEAITRLRLNDAALSFEPESNDALGRGLKVGFLGQLHFEITSDRLRREFNLEFLTSFPTIAYRVIEAGKERVVKQPQDFPEKPDKVFEPMIRVEILTPESYLNQILNLKSLFDLAIIEIRNLGLNLLLHGRMPLSELIRDFDDRLKSVSAGFASFSYELDGEEETEVEKLEILIAGELQPALTRITKSKDIEHEARLTVERLKKFLPPLQFSQALQARAKGRIIARETIPALRKDVTGYLYGGDRTRKMKLWKKQKKGKEKLKKLAKVSLSPAVFRELLKK
ncbi:MAG: elongation factor 4 [Candidatus Liptonbacteria bacterium]|nr:elongation factor 4 [Candidatus Liptonbacteria bacterium]